MGQDKLNSAFTEMMWQDPKADALLDQAMDKFEASVGKRSKENSKLVLPALGLCCWAGHRHMLKARVCCAAHAQPGHKHAALHQLAARTLIQYRNAPPAPALQDQVCYGMYNQATVHQYSAEFALFKAAREGQPASSVAAEAEGHLKAS